MSEDSSGGKGAGSVAEDPGRAQWLARARSYLRGADPVLARLIDDRPDFDPQAWLAELPPMDLYGALLFQVTGPAPGSPRLVPLSPRRGRRAACPSGAAARGGAGCRR